jgi:hypothetical protein
MQEFILVKMAVMPIEIHFYQVKTGNPVTVALSWDKYISSMKNSGF